MITDSRINRFTMQWTEICRHTYERLSRAKWRIKMDYACGAHMTLENMPDDLIQCLVRGAVNSGIPVETNLGTVGIRTEAVTVAATWVDVHGWLFERGP
ncbi:MAG: hypothetical protein FJX11_08915 [Alphaproteobacteria bacterium]|nr:hypothetical protein [Alphaproteobacteria bacterium]